MRALGLSEDPRAVAALGRAALGDTELVRMAAAEALGRLGGDEARAILLQQVKDANPAVRRAAAEALARDGGGSLMDLADAVADPIEAAAVAGTIRALASNPRAPVLSAPTTLPGEPDKPPSASESVEETIARLNAKAGTGDEGAMLHLIALWAAAEDFHQKMDKAVDNLAAPAGVDFFGLAAWSIDEAVRRQALDRLVKAGAPAAGPLVAIAVSRPPSLPSVQPRLTFGPPGLFRSASTEEDRAKAAEAVVKIGQPAVEPLKDAFRSGGAAQRDLAVSLLDRMGKKDVAAALVAERVAALIADLDAEKPAVRRRAEKGLVEIGQRAVEAIARQLNDVSPARRETAAELLGRMGGDKAVKALIAALDDEYAPIRAQAVAALEYTGDRRAVPHLKRLAEKDPDETTRLAADRALKKLAETQPTAP